jgi:hypothetical protein
MVGILEPQYRIGQIQGQVVKADTAAKSLVPEQSTQPVVDAVKEAEAWVRDEEEIEEISVGSRHTKA